MLFPLFFPVSFNCIWLQFHWDTLCKLPEEIKAERKSSYYRKNVVKGEYSLVFSIAKHWNWCLVPEIIRMTVIDNESICELSVCALGYIFWHPNSHTMKVNVMEMVWLSERPPVKATTRHSLILHLKRAKVTDRNFQLRNKFNREEISMSKKKMKWITRIQETIFKILGFVKLFPRITLGPPSDHSLPHDHVTRQCN